MAIAGSAEPSGLQDMIDSPRRKHKPTHINTSIDQPYLISADSNTSTDNDSHASHRELKKQQSELIRSRTVSLRDHHHKPELNSAPVYGNAPASIRSRSTRAPRKQSQPLLKTCLDSISLFSPTSLTVSIESQIHSPRSPMIINSPPARQPAPTSKSRWWTPEFILYWIVLAYSLNLIISSTIQLSQVDHPNYDLYKHKLSNGWILNRKIDNSDSQYRRFRLGLSKLSLLSLAYLSLSKLSQRLIGLRRAHFQSISSALILTVLHGTSVIKILCIVSANYFVSRLLLSRFPRISSILVWTTNLSILFANDYWDGYQFRHLSHSLAFLDDRRYKGLIPRWQIGFNISMLRLISYALDYQWAAKNNFETLVKSAEPEVEKERAKSNRTQSDYCFQNYFNYIFYPPLYIAGPIITFNNFISQMNKRPSTITMRAIVGYTGRFAICFFTLEWILHYMYVVAIKDTHAWRGDTPFELGIIGYWNLIIIWLKLLIPWRFFRLWALLDGVDPPENMIRCMSNNFSTLEFWRSWHRSYNLWIVRYLYIPLGGSKNMIPSTVIVFTFVALWHDLSFKLLTWGWLVSFFVLPEVIAKKTFSKSSYKSQPWFRHLVALGGTLNVMTMMSANLVGFSIGTDGVKFMWHELLGSWAGVRVLLAILFVVFCAVQVMIEYREAEAREGILRKC
ncbi:hypothetical protein PCANC_03134 [Puccinia coronata f. sp. avenae]|uniref:Glycerol transporter n=1 Tax=Puccinia coronata f. sp. avenae TaxID=200324 RepID=A0A2N5W4Q0_9BASI|nr:hypothetical protein PCANC_03134 [Puccinia coronata f. sp. avenae]